MVNKTTKGKTKNYALMNKPSNRAIPNDAYKIPITIVANHLIYGEIKKEVITIQALKEMEYLVEHNINDTMHVTLEVKN